MMKKSIKAGLVSTTLAASLLLSTTGVFAFTDVDSGHWAANDIAKLSGSGYINGYEDGTFAPDSFITRAEFVTIINKVMGVTARTYKVYPDVSTDAWYAEQIDIASTAGYINGYDDGTIKPDAPISRAEVAVVCYKAWGLTPEGNVGFTDSSSIGSWAKVQIATLAAKNILSGYEDGSFRPGDAIKRAEVAKIISRLLDMKSGNTVTSVTQQGIGTPAGLANTSVIIKGGNSSSGSSSGSSSSSSSSNTKPSSSQKKALEAFVEGDVDSDDSNDYLNTLKAVLGYSDCAKSTDVKKNYITLYDDAVSALISEMEDKYEDYDLDTKSDAKALANDIGAVVLAVNNAVEKVRTLCGKGDLDLDNLLDYAEDMEKTIKNNAGNGKKVYNIIFDFCAELYSRFENDIDKINGTKISTNDVVAIYNREYDFDNTKDEPSSSQKTALDNAVKKPDQITKSDLDKIIGYSDSNVKTDKDLVVVYQDAVSELVKNIGYDTSSKSDASRLADDVACVVEVANESIDKVLELAKAGNLNADTLLGFKSEIDSIIDSTASSANKAEVKNAVNDFAIALYGKLDGKLSEINGNADLTVEKLLEFYNANK